MPSSTRVRTIRLPDSDGKPMADNPLQFEWITTLKWGFETLYLDNPDVFVAGDHLIYPIEPEEGQEDTAPRIAPDTYIAFGRPKVYRGSYKVWEEEGVFPQVVFEVWSPGNRQQQMEDKRRDYESYGVEEYYIVYPEFPAYVDGWIREGGSLARIADIKTWTSPRTGVRFDLRTGKLRVIRPDGKKFLTYVEINQQMEAAELHAEQEAKRAEQEAKRAEQETKRAEQEAKRAESAEQRAARMAAKLRDLGLDPDAT